MRLYPLCLLVTAVFALSFPALAYEEGDLSKSPGFGPIGLPLSPKAKISPATTIRVKVFPHRAAYPPHGLDKDKKSVTLKSSKGCQLYAGHKRRAGRRGSVKKRGKIFQFSTSSLHQPAFLKCSGHTTVVRAADLTSFSYLGSFYIRKNHRGNLEVINLLNLYQYLRGVVPSEVFPGWPMEALKAQSVAARTYTVYHLRQSALRGKRYWDVDDTIRYQAYTGTTIRNPRTDLAIGATKGQILTYGNNVIQAYYHADSGGQTESAEHVWGQEIPYCEGRKEVFETEVPTNAWKVKLSLREVTMKLRRARLIPPKSWVRNLVVPAAGRSDSGRVKTVSVELNNGKFRTITYRPFSLAIGKQSFQSSLFTVKRDHKKRFLTFEGLGFGHGVGMNQIGALHLARDLSWTYDKILHFYYSGIRLCALDGKDQGDLKGCYPGPRRFEPSNIFTEKTPDGRTG